ncbi:unnamed protein product [Fraxinus pennsylvanica]|uniref:Transcription elongation factor 1 homolog n=1 Tax=Fraxinus pennsylvanica TaxID=56036 RepID=A0AAD1YT66_9LAMI|nr:unnamed protein product [Fraxinus pennsylvanica]
MGRGGMGWVRPLFLTPFLPESLALRTDIWSKSCGIVRVIVRRIFQLRDGCPFCNHGTSVECRIDMKNLIGEASCRICQESFSTTVTALTEPIDIYSEWIDECERVNNNEEDVE